MVSRGSSDSIRFSAGEQMIAQSNMPNFGWARGNRRILALETIAIKGESTYLAAQDRPSTETDRRLRADSLAGTQQPPFFAYQPVGFRPAQAGRPRS